MDEFVPGYSLAVERRHDDRRSGDMSRSEADELLAAVLHAVPEALVAVQPDGAHWVVQVNTRSAGVFTLYDEADWKWLQPQIVRGSSS
jgi:hypothetical protein